MIFLAILNYLSLRVTRVNIFSSTAYCIWYFVLSLLFTWIEKQLIYALISKSILGKCHATCTFHHLSVCHFGYRSDSISHDSWDTILRTLGCARFKSVITRMNCDCAKINLRMRKRKNIYCLHISSIQNASANVYIGFQYIFSSLSMTTG